MDDCVRSPLRTAIEAMESDQALELIKRGQFDPSEPLLSLAVRLDLPAVTEALLKAGFNVNARDEEELNPLYRALTAKDPLSWVQKLLAAGADPNAQVGRHRIESILNRAVCQSIPEVVALLLESGADPNRMDESGDLPLVEAATKPEMVKLLLAAGAEVEQTDRRGRRALLSAARQRSLESVRLLLKAGANPNASDKNKVTPLACAAAGGVVEIFDALVEAGASVEKDALWEALMGALIGGEAASGFFKRMAWNGEDDDEALNLDQSLEEISKAYFKNHRDPKMYVEMVNKLLSMGVDVSRKGEALLMYPAGMEQIEVMRSLLRAGADVNDQYSHARYFAGRLDPGESFYNRNGTSALHRAAQRASIGSILELLRQGAAVNLPDEGGVTPLMTAAFYKQPKIVKLLLKAGADPLLTDCEGNTALAYARREFCDECVELLSYSEGKDNTLRRQPKNMGNIELLSNNEIPFDWAYWVIPGKLLAGCYPGSPKSAEAERKMQSLYKAGIKTFLNLMEENETNYDDEPFAPYQGILQEQCINDAVNLKYVRYPIRDLSTPTRSYVKEILDFIDEELEQQTPLYVHCWGGIGRTGVIVGCHLARHGRASGESAIEMIKDMRSDLINSYVDSPETEEQRKFITFWARGE